MKTLTLLCFCALLASCSAFTSLKERGEQRNTDKRPSLAELALQPLSVEPSVAPKLSLAATREEYAALLPLLTDKKQSQQVAFRLADIEMQLAERAQETGVSSFVQAISLYQEVLEQQAKLVSELDFSSNDPVVIEQAKHTQLKYMDAMYQLSRALDLNAQADESVAIAQRFLSSFSTQTHALTPYHIELYFRVGEYYFNRQQYDQAVFNYAQVLSLSKQSADFASNNFYGIAAYMQAWSYFKQEEYNEALLAFSKMLDDALAQNSYAQTHTPIASLSLGQQKIVKDTLRVMALLFSYQGNGEAIKDFFVEHGERAYAYLIYEQLAQQHLNDSRYQDSADALLVFARTYPMHEKAVAFYVKHIDAYILGQFPLRVLEAKQGFVSAYGIDGPYFTGMNTANGRQSSVYLRQYLKELAQNEHSIAQHKDNNALDFTNDDELRKIKQQAFSNAAGYYEQFIRTFSPDDEVPQMRFYLAEALSSSQQWEAAIENFELYAYQDSPNPMANEAAYAALLLFEELGQQAPNHPQASSEQFEARKMNSQSQFIRSFAGDPRSVNVAQSLMQGLFGQQQYHAAMRWGHWLLSADSTHGRAYAQSLVGENIKASARGEHVAAHIVPSETLISARLTLAHSHFALQNYHIAQADYESLLEILSPDDTRVKALHDRLAATIFQQSEQILAAANIKQTLAAQPSDGSDFAQFSVSQSLALQDSIALLTRIIQQTPDATFRAAAQYDATTYLLALQQFDKALPLLLDFQTRFATSSLAKTIPSRLLLSYENLQTWLPAANLLLAQHHAAPNTTVGQESLFVAAEYFLKAGRSKSSRLAYRLYANTYPSPLADANEARLKMTEFYAQSGDQRRRRFWFNKLIAADRDAGDERSERSRFLAAMATMVFAKDADEAYQKIKLTLPLNESLARKQSALNNAIAHYDSVMAYGIAQYTTQANFALANLYTVLAQDLMDSSRPTGLSPLELSQYEMLLEEQAFPFEETAITLHENNAKRSYDGLYDEWVKASLQTLQGLLPVRYRKQELIEELNADDFE